MQSFVVGKPFPGPVPQKEGSVMEIWEGGPVVLIQYPGLKTAEVKAFKKGFKRYGYLESKTSVPIACWVFEFAPQFGMIEAVVNARIIPRNLLDDLFNKDEGIKNAVQFFLLDGPILKAMKLSGIQPNAMRLFHATLKKQLSMEYTPSEYDASLAQLFQSPTDDLFEKSTIFRHR